MAVESWVWVLIPLGWAVAFGFMVTALFMFLAARHQATATAAASYQALAQEALRSQQEMTKTLSGMVTTHKDIEKVLTEV